MRELLFLTGCFVLLAAAGCKKPPEAIGEKSGVNVIIEGGGEFPEFLAGRWKADKGGWEFVFERDGSISSAVIKDGTIEGKPGKGVTKTTFKQVGTVEYELGVWTVQYTPYNRELVVEVVVDYFKLDVGITTLEGKSRDSFIGPVSEEDGIWEAEWFSFPEHFVLLQKPQKIPFDPNNNPIDTLVFKKQNGAN